MEEVRNVLQSVLRGGSKFWVFYSYNPPRSKNNWVNFEMSEEYDDRIVISNTYLDVPEEWLGQAFINEANKLKERRPDLYRHEYLGEVIGTGGNVFDNVEAYEMTDKLVMSFDKTYHGIDFGFSIDPFAFVSVYYDKRQETIYIYDEICEQKLSNRNAAKQIFEKIGNKYVCADSADLRSIDDMRGYGLNVFGCKKGQGSVEFGIHWLQSLTHIFIDPRRCPNAYKEFSSYEYDKNKEGEFISRYPDKDNHCVTGDTLILTTDGYVTIESMVGTCGTLLCLDTASKKITESEYFDCRMTQENAEIFEVTLDNGNTVKATANHPFYTDRGWVELKDLTEEDYVYCY